MNWPGLGGGATMMYYDQGMFEEVNYLTSAIPAEVMAGGISINMVTKDAGNKWRGNTKYYYSDQKLQSDNTTDPSLPTGFLGNPTKNLYDFNIAGGGAIAQDKLWVNGSIRRWVVNKYVAARNPDGSQALDDNTLKNYSGKAVYSESQNNKFTFSYNWNNKIRGHRRDTPPDFVPDIASLVQTNPAWSSQGKYTGIHHQLVYESSFSLMKGVTNYGYQPGTPAAAIRTTDSSLDSASFATTRQESQPNSRLQFDNILSYSKSGWGGDHLFKGGIQFARLYFQDQYYVQNGLYLNYNNGKAVSVSEYNTPVASTNIVHTLGGFFQDSWTVQRLTVNLGVRYDHNTGILPAQSTAGGPFIGPQSYPESNPISQGLFVWRTGLVYDPIGDGTTALKANYSRYGLQVGIDRVTNVNPLTAGSRTCPWTDPNPESATSEPSLATVLTEINTAQCTAFPTLKVHYANPNGPRWPYSDEITAGIERQVIPDMRVGIMYYRRTNRDQIGEFNQAVPPSDYVPVTVNVPNGPGGVPTTAVVYNLSSSSLVSASNLVLDNASYLDTTYSGVEITANKRMSHRWQMVAGLTIGQNKGGLNGNSTGLPGQSTTTDLNDPNNTLYSNGVVGYDSKVAFRLSGSYVLPKDITIAGSLISNGGFPYVSTYTVTRALVPSLVRSTQTVYSERPRRRAAAARDHGRSASVEGVPVRRQPSDRPAAGHLQYRQLVDDRWREHRGGRDVSRTEPDRRAAHRPRRLLDRLLITPPRWHFRVGWLPSARVRRRGDFQRRPSYEVQSRRLAAMGSCAAAFAASCILGGHRPAGGPGGQRRPQSIRAASLPRDRSRVAIAWPPSWASRATLMSSSPAPLTAASGRPATAASTGSPSSTTKTSRRSARWPSRLPRTTSCGPERAKPGSSAPTTPWATASTNRPTAARRGSTWASTSPATSAAS